MTIAAAPPRRTSGPPAPGGAGVLLEGISWALYEGLLREAGEQHVRMTYDRGRLELMPPLPEHERWKKAIGRMIEILTLDLDIPLEPLGSTTFRREDLQRGLEPDECYYVRHEAEIRGKNEIDLAAGDPPPDLVIEIDITHRAIGREEIYAAMGVPELWRFDGETLTALRLDAASRDTKDPYRPIETSLAFPMLRPAELARFLSMLGGASQTAVMRAFRDWVREQFIKS